MQQRIDQIVKVRDLLPIIDPTWVESTTKMYALRLTPFDKYTKDDILYDLLNTDKIQHYIATRETSKKDKEHFHLVLWSLESEKTLRAYVKEFLDRKMGEKKVLGEGNKRYNLSEARDLEQAIIYILKDGDDIYCSSFINQDVLEKMKKLSYKKYSKEDFGKAFEELKIQFKAERTSVETMMTRVVELKSLYRQPVNMTYIFQMCLSFDIHNNPSHARSCVKDYLSRINFVN